ncbi:MAG: PEP/pyruvate-binding domain-containing protein, partial [Polyangia bacterium]
MARPLRDVADDPACGRKAQTLARLAVAGLPVPDGLVVLPDDPLDDALLAQLVALGPGPYAVRSSSALEDGVRGSAAGLYESIIGVGVPGLIDAIARVRASARDEAVVAYLASRDLQPTSIAVLVQAAVEAAILGVARTTTRGYLVEERPAGSPEWSDTVASELLRRAEHPVAALLARVEAELLGPLDVEYARTDAHLVLLQARPTTSLPPVAAGTWPPGRWRLDAEHNPDPISVSQAGLVALVEGRRFGARSRVIDGYLYVREEKLGPTRAADIDALARFREELEPALRAELAATEGAPLDDVLATYRRTMRRYAAEVRPSLSATRHALDEILHRELGTRLSDHGRLLGGTGGATSARDVALYELGREPTEERLSDYLALYGAYAPAWDVQVACDDEDLPRLRAHAQRRSLGPSPSARVAVSLELAAEERRVLARRLSRDGRRVFEARLELLRSLLTLGESDDLLFFEGQRLVRLALLERGRELARRGQLASVDDVFFVALDRLRAVDDLRTEVALARAARLRADRRVPPHRIVDRRPLVRTPDS